MENSRELGVVGGESREGEMGRGGGTLTLARGQRWHRNVVGVPESEPGSPSCGLRDAENKMTDVWLFL